MALTWQEGLYFHLAWTTLQERPDFEHSSRFFSLLLLILTMKDRMSSPLVSPMRQATLVVVLAVAPTCGLLESARPLLFLTSPTWRIFPSWLPHRKLRVLHDRGSGLLWPLMWAFLQETWAMFPHLQLLSFGGLYSSRCIISGVRLWSSIYSANGQLHVVFFFFPTNGGRFVSTENGS